MSKNTVLIILIALIVLGTGAAIFFLGGEEPAPKPEAVSKRIKIVTPEEAAKPAMEVVKIEPSPEPKPAVKPAPTPPAPKPVVKKAPKKAVYKPWVVNVSSFSQKKEALAFAEKLRGAGYTPYLTEFTMDGVKWHRVRVGFFKTKAEAKRVGDELSVKFKQPGAWIVKPMRSEVLKHMK